MKLLFKRHWVAVALAIAIGLTCAGPQLYFARTAQYKGITMTGADGEEHYLARMEEIREGHWRLGNVFLPNKDQPGVGEGIGEALSLAVGLPFDLSAAQAEALSKFLFPFLVALALYGLGYAISGSRSTSLGFTLMPMLSETLVSSPHAWVGLIQGKTSNINFLTFSRPVNPEVSAVCLIFGLLFLYRIFLARSARSWDQAALGILTALTLYISIYTYTFLGLWILLFFLWTLYRREWHLSIKALLVGAVGLLGGVPFLLNYFSLVRQPDYASLALRTGVIVTHAPVIGLWIPLILMLTLLAWPQRFRAARPLFIISALSIAILSNQQVVTGHALQVDHYHWYITKPLAGMVIALYLGWAAERLLFSRPVRIALWAVLFFVLGYNAVLIQTISYHTHLPQALAAQAYAPTLNAINRLPPGQVVWASRNLSLYIPIYTTADAPNNDYAMYYLVPQSYLEERLMLEYRLRGIQPDRAYTTMQAERVDIAKRLFGVYWRDQAGAYAAIPDSLLATYAAEYRQEYRLPLSELYHRLGITVTLKQ